MAERVRKGPPGKPGAVAAADRYRMMAESSHDFIFIVGRSGRVEYVNRASASIMKAEPEELVGRLYTEIFPARTLVTVTAQLEKAFATGESGAAEGAFEFPDRVLWLHTQFIPVPGADGEMSSVIGISRDITARKLIEDSLREKSVLLESLLKALPVGVWIADARGRIVSGNEAVRRIWGGSRNVGIDGYGEYKGWRADTGKRIEAGEWALARAVSNGETVLDEIIDIEAFDGARKTILNSAVPLRGADGRVTGGVAVNQDVTGRRRAENELRWKQHLLAEAQRAAHLGSWDLDLASGRLRWSEEMYRIFGVAPEAFEPTADGFIRLLHPDDREAMARWIDGTVGGRKQDDLDFRVVLPDGTVRFVTGTGEPMRDDDGPVIGAFGTALDVTGRKKAEETLRQAIHHKEVLMRELQHRVKNSLAMVSGLLSLEAANLADARSRDVFASTRSRIGSIAALYERLYRASDIDRVDLGPYIRDLAEALFRTYAIGPGNRRLKTRMDEVRLDTKRAIPLGLILNELLINSLKYAYPAGADGEVRIDLRDSGDAITLAVEDDGAGFPDEFDPADSGGTGMNLVRMLAEELDGGLAFGAGKGARVSLTFKI